MRADAPVEGDVYRAYQEKFSRIRFEHKQFRTMFQLIGRCHTQAGIRRRTRGFSIVGPPGAGKSIIGEAYAEQFPPYRGENGVMQVPVVYFEIPNRPTERSIISECLRAIGDPAHDRGSAPKLKHQLDDWINRCTTQLIIFDELQRLIDDANRDVAEHAAEFFKTLADDRRHCVSMVFLTLENGLTVFKKTKKNKGQLKARIGKAVKLEPLVGIDDDGVPEYQKLMGTLQRALGEPYSQFDMTEPNFVEKMFQGSTALPGPSSSITAGALENVLFCGRDYLTEGDFYYGFERWIQTDVEDLEGVIANPFTRNRSSYARVGSVQETVAYVKRTMSLPYA